MELPTIDTLGELEELARGRADLFVRWSQGPEEDLREHRSFDDLTSTELAGLSANSLAVEEWWTGPDELWLARRIYDLRMVEAAGGEWGPLDRQTAVDSGRSDGGGA